MPRAVVVLFGASWEEPMPTSPPSEDTAIAIARRVLAWSDTRAQRFTTGMAFFVYEVTHGADLAVVRIGRPEQASALAEGRALQDRLRPLGVPLPDILAHGVQDGVALSGHVSPGRHRPWPRD